jgi:6-phosphogluconolactonase (cycloisomerase 2 family)
MRLCHGMFQQAGSRPRQWCFLAAWLAAFAWLATADAQEVAPDRELEARIDRLIVQLDDEKFRTRESAERELLEIGQPALARLEAAAKDSSLERSERAARLLRDIRRGDMGMRHLSTVATAELNGAVNLALSPDGKFLYCPSWRTNSICILRTNPVSGGLERHGTLFDGERLNGVVQVRLSQDGKQAVATSFRAKSVCLFSRDADNGSLTLLASRTTTPEAEMKWPTDSVLSADGRFIYTADDQGGAVLVFRVADKQLEFVERFVGQDDCFARVRRIVLHPSGKTLITAAGISGTLCLLDRDATSGRLSVRQVLRSGEGDWKGLAGVIGIECSKDGRFVYTSSGRFAGASGVAVWKVDADGKLSQLQVILNGDGTLTDFEGGNDIRLSSNGKYLYASGTTSSALACFRRDATSGKLEHETTIRNEATGAETNLGANGLACSLDDRFVYLSLEDTGAISVFERTKP